MNSRYLKYDPDQDTGTSLDYQLTWNIGGISRDFNKHKSNKYRICHELNVKIKFH